LTLWGAYSTRATKVAKPLPYAYDAAGRLVSVTNPLGDSTTYAYDALANLTSIRDANGHVTSFEYDDLNRRIRKTWPDASFEAFGYDALGNLLSQRLADGNTNIFDYDEMSRLAQASYFDGQSLSYGYTPTGQRSSVVDGRGTTRYTYDDLDRLTVVTVPSGLSVSYTYDAAGNRSSMTTPAGVVDFDYDDANRLSAVTDPLGGTYSYTYDAEGRRTQLDMPNGLIVDYRYDLLDQVIGITHRTSSSVLASYDYTLDPAGNRLGVSEADGSSIAWTYDDAYRLIGETRFDPGGSPSAETSFTYDPVGNRRSMTVDGATTNYTYNNLDQLLTAGPTTFGYDARGNLTQASSGADVAAYSWDALDRLSDVTLPDGAALAYTYDADGRRVRQVVGGAGSNYLWDEASLYGDVVLETDAGGATLASYVLGGAELLSQTRAGTTGYYLPDAQGSTRALTNGAGAVTDTYDYTAFGELFGVTGTTTNAYLYTGQEFDALTGLYSLRARYYDPEVGRFLSLDQMELQIFNPMQLDRYAYVGNNPVNLIDPLGTQSLRSYIATAFVGLQTAPAASQLAIALGASYAVASVLLMMAQAGELPNLPYNPAFPDPWQGVRDFLNGLNRQGEIYRDIANAATAILIATLAKLLEQEITRVRTREIPRRYSLDTNALVALEYWMILGVDDQQGQLPGAKLSGQRVFYSFVAESEFLAKGTPAGLAEIVSRYGMTLVPSVPGELIQLVIDLYLGAGKKINIGRTNDIQVIAAALLVNSNLLTRDPEILGILPPPLAGTW